MDKENRLKILQNLDYIATNLCSLPRLLNLLLQESVISQVEVETIECLQPRYKAATELANLITKKDNKTFPVFITCLFESGNETIALRLMTDAKTKEMRQQIWFGVTAPNKFYTGRQKEMEVLEKYFEDCVAQKTLSIVALTGLGGIGKSEIAKNFANWFYKHVQGHCIWMDAETHQSVEESFKNLAAQLKINLNDQLGKERIFLEIVEEVYEKLFGENVLLVFDNVENYDSSVLKLLLNLSAKKPPTVLRPFVVTTSRFVEANKHFGSLCNQINLEVLGKESAINFFYKSLSLSEPAKENLQKPIDRLCQRLQFYPLAMQQALAFITQKAPSNDALSEAIQIYLDEMENISKDLLNYQLPQYDALDSTSKTTLVTWRITFEKLRELSGGLAVDIMNIISFLSPDNIPAHLVIKILEKTKNISNVEIVEDFFDIIRKHSMINSPDVKIKEMSVHRLVQEVTRIELGERGEFRSVLSVIVRCMISMLEDEEISLKELIHAQMMWQHLGREKVMIEDHADLPRWICIKLQHSGKYRDLLDFSRESFGLLKSVLGQNSRLALRMKYWEGVALRDLGEYSESMEVLKDVYEKQKETFGEEDKDSLDTAQSLGSAYWRLDRNEEALETYKNILEKTERVFGKEGRRTLDLKHNIALVLKPQNKGEEALELYAEVLEVQERLLGVEDPHTLTTKHNIATVKLKQKDYLEALKEFQEVLEIRERVLEVNHPNTLLTKYNIAVAYYYLGRHQESLEMFKEVHEHHVQILGPRHPHRIETEQWIDKVEIEIAKSAESVSKPKRKCAVQ